MTNWKAARQIPLLIIWPFLRPNTMKYFLFDTFVRPGELLGAIPGVLMNGNNSLSYQFPTSWLYALKMFNRPERRDIPVFSANTNYVSTWEGTILW